MEKFPNELELIAASALLLLPIAVFHDNRISEIDVNNDPIYISSSCEESEAERDKSVTSDSNCTDSSWLSSDCSSGAVQVKRMKVMSTFTAKLKNLRRRRSKIQRSFHGHKLASKKACALVRFHNVSETASEASCVTSSRSELSSGRSRKDERTPATIEEEKKRRGSISYNIRQRAGDILNFLSRGCSSEVRIRQVLGDSPDTSKALRILLKRAEIKRSGAGGRSDPYIYKISAEAQERPADRSRPLD